jgi:hypothetical protein
MNQASELVIKVSKFVRPIRGQKISIERKPEQTWFLAKTAADLVIFD